MKQVMTNEATAAKRVMVFPLLVDATDGITAETGEAAGQPQYSIDGGANWVNTGGTLTGGTGGAYQVQLTQAEVNQAVGTSIIGRYKSANTAEARAIPIQVVGYDPGSALSTYAGGAVASVTAGVTLATDSVSAAAVKADAAAEIAEAVQTLLAGENVKSQREAVQRDESDALRRTIYFYATGTLPAKASISKNGGAFADSTNAPATVSGNFRELELAAAEIDTLGKLTINVTTTVTPFTAILLVDVVDFDPFAEGAVSDLRLRQLRGARPAA